MRHAIIIAMSVAAMLGAAPGCDDDDSSGLDGGTCRNGEMRCSGLYIESCIAGEWGYPNDCRDVCVDIGLPYFQYCGYSPVARMDACICSATP